MTAMLFEGSHDAGMPRLRGSVEEGEEILGHNESDCPKEREVDKSEELKVLGCSPLRVEENRDGFDSFRALILSSSFWISREAACFKGNWKSVDEGEGSFFCGTSVFLDLMMCLAVE